jgi:hypothetical protein
MLGPVSDPNRHARAGLRPSPLTKVYLLGPVSDRARPINVMRSLRLLSIIALLLVLLAACRSLPQPVVERDAAPAAGQASQVSSEVLLLEAIDADRTVQPGADEVFDFKMVNTMGQPLSVVVVLEHADGQRWRTSLCVEKQCLLGDGSESSVTDPVILPPYLEQAFEAHLFVDAAARSGQQTGLTLRVEPQISDGMSHSVALRARVVER